MYMYMMYMIYYYVKYGQILEVIVSIILEGLLGVTAIQCYMSNCQHLHILNAGSGLHRGGCSWAVQNILGQSEVTRQNRCLRTKS